MIGSYSLTYGFRASGGSYLLSTRDPPLEAVEDKITAIQDTVFEINLI